MEANLKKDDPARPVVVFIGGDSAMIERALALGLDVFLIQKPRYFESATLQNTVGVLVIDYETCQGIVEIVATLRQQFKIVCAVSLTEFGLLTAAQINHALGLPGVSLQAVRQTRDKAAMRVATADVQKLPSRVVHDAESAANFGNETNWPIIIKPLDGYGSRLVSRADNAFQLADIDWSAGHYLAERFIAGRLVSVEAFSCDGNHRIYAVNEEFPVGQDGPSGCNPYVEVAHRMPAAISAAELAQLHRLLPQILDALDLREGPSHTEFILGDHGPVLVECHTRVGGDFIPEMIQRCTGVDLISAAIGWPAGHCAPPEPTASWPRAAMLKFFTPPPGRVTRITGVDACEDIPGVAMVKLRLKPGDMVAPLRYAADRVGFVMAICTTPEEAAARCDEVLEKVKIELEPPPGA